MGKPTGFMEIARAKPNQRRAEERVRDHLEFDLQWDDRILAEQGARCMDCGVPTCHGEGGCPLGNLIPDWNDLVMRDNWDDALQELHRTNNFPDFTGRICPAPCEDNCILGINEEPVTIKAIEKAIIEHGAQKHGLIPHLPSHHSGKKVAVIGSGPAGLAAAQNLARLGHQVTVFEKQDRLGGLLTYGIPNFKLEQSVVERRIDQMRAEGVSFHLNCEVGKDLSAQSLQANHDAILLACGAEQARPLSPSVKGKDLAGIHFAMDFLIQQNRRNYQDVISAEESISAEGKHVVILGGGDTGADCLGTSHRQGALHTFQYDIIAQPEKIKIGSAHEEGGTRQWGTLVKGFSGHNGQVSALQGVKVEWLPASTPGQFPVMREIEGSEFEQEVQLVLLAMGFIGPVQAGLLKELGVTFHQHNAVWHDGHYQTNQPGVFVAGDCSKGASLVVWAIQEGRDSAFAIHRYLMSQSQLYQAAS